MWSRAQLKEKAKYTFKLNYWKVVIVTFLAIAIGAGTTSASGFELQLNKENNLFEQEESNELDEFFYDEFNSFNNFEDFEDLENFDDFQDYGYSDMPQIEIESMDEIMEGFLVLIGMFFLVFIIVLIIVLIISLVWGAFIANPIEVGAKKFFVQSLNEKAEVKELLFSFDSSYKNIAKVMFLRTLYTMLWSLLFVIPGIVKAYEYRMIPYLLAENPNLSKEQAFALSKQMMMGQKWNTFVLDLSFIGWDILSTFTLGILSIFYVGPYKNMTDAALYEELSNAYGHPARNVANPYEQPYYEQQSYYTKPEE